MAKSRGQNCRTIFTDDPMITSRTLFSIAGSSVIFLLKKLFYDRRIIGKAGKDDHRIIEKSIVQPQIIIGPKGIGD